MYAIMSTCALVNIVESTTTHKFMFSQIGYLWVGLVHSLVNWLPGWFTVGCLVSWIAD